jgi:hypothetical protein
MLTSHQKRFLTIIFVAVFLIAPIEILHALVWFVFHIYELLEFILDEVIHHVFHTSRHTTQVIVFYLMIAIVLSVIYLTVRTVRLIFTKQNIVDFFQPVYFSRKAQMIFGFTFGFAFLALTVF